jgi:hypothetical protein
MDIQYPYRFCYCVAFLTGIAGGCFALRFCPSGKRALAIALGVLPDAGAPRPRRRMAVARRLTIG